MYSPNTENIRRQWPDDVEKLSHAEGDASGRPIDAEDELEALLATGDTRKRQPPEAGRFNPWPIGSRIGTLPGGNSRGSMDPIGQFVYQEHNSFFRTRMPKATHWSVVWSDLMMTMFIFFVVLFVFFSLHPRGLGSRSLLNRNRSLPWTRFSPP